MLTSVVRNIFRTNLAVRKNERCLVFTDTPSEHEAIDQSECGKRAKLNCIALLAAELGHEFAREILYHEFPATGSHGTEPPIPLWQLAFGKRAVAELRKKRVLDPILEKRASSADLEKARLIVGRFQDDAVHAVIALSNYSTSHTRFRDLLTGICKTRYASMPLFEISMLEGAMNVDWKALAKRTREVAARVNRAEAVEISTSNGTNISFSIKGRKAMPDTGLLTKPGAFGNLPAGEAFLAPVEGTANGTLVLEWAPTRELKSPLTLTVKDGMVREVSGTEEYADVLRKNLAIRHENRNIAELGIGTNSQARRPDNILESEKILGTIHIAFGDNSSFGGTVATPFHQDFIFFRPTVTLVHPDSSRTHLMKNGKFVD